MYVCMYVCMSVCVCMYVCMYGCMHACMYVCICIYIYTHWANHDHYTWQMDYDSQGKKNTTSSLFTTRVVVRIRPWSSLRKWLLVVSTDSTNSTKHQPFAQWRGHRVKRRLGWIKRWWFGGFLRHGGTPKSSILIDFSIINHPAIGIPTWLWKPPFCSMVKEGQQTWSQVLGP